MEQPTYTISGIGRRLVEGGLEFDSAKLTNQLRHFGNVGLLRPTGHVNTGTGRNRYFQPQEIVRAALLVTLARFDTNIGRMRQFMDELDEAIKKRHKGADLITIAKSAKDLWIIFLLDETDKGEVRARARFLDGTTALSKLEYPSMVIGLTRVASQLGV
jgi:DNA-binding transcriptional MerR regulator